MDKNKKRHCIKCQKALLEQDHKLCKRCQIQAKARRGKVVAIAGGVGSVAVACIIKKPNPFRLFKQIKH